MIHETRIGFTPGPWKTTVPEIEGVADPTYRTIQAGVGYFSEDQEEPAGFILTGFIRPEDAALIAAAPEMYAALKKIHDNLGDPARGVLFGIRAAIAKAEGHI